jgi:hypothetical protein
MGLSFVIAAGPRQRIHWLRPYFTVSDSKLPCLSPPTTRRATVEVFDLASTLLINWQKEKLTACNQPARSLLASGPAGTQGHIFVQCQELWFFFPFVDRPYCPTYNISARTAHKTPFLCCSAVIAVETCLFAEPLLSNSCFIVAYFAVVA